MQFVSFKCPVINSTDEIVFINKSLASRTPIIIVASNQPVSRNGLKILIIQIFHLKIVQSMIVFMTSIRLVHLDVEDQVKELLRQLSYAI